MSRSITAAAILEQLATPTYIDEGIPYVAYFWQGSSCRQHLGTVNLPRDVAGANRCARDLFGPDVRVFPVDPTQAVGYIGQPPAIQPTEPNMLTRFLATIRSILVAVTKTTRWSAETEDP